MSAFSGPGGSMREHRELKRVDAEARNTAYRRRIANRESPPAPALDPPAEPWRKYHQRTNATGFDGSCQPCGKRIYRTRSRARQAIKSLGGQAMRPYPCPEPAGGWHIGHYEPKAMRGATSLAYEPPRKHSCGPNRYGYWLAHGYDRPGTVRVCECGRSWVALKDPNPGSCVNIWKPEGRFARWRRERKTARRG